MIKKASNDKGIERDTPERQEDWRNLIKVGSKDRSKLRYVCVDS